MNRNWDKKPPKNLYQDRHVCGPSCLLHNKGKTKNISEIKSRPKLNKSNCFTFSDTISEKRWNDIFKKTT